MIDFSVASDLYMRLDKFLHADCILRRYILVLEYRVMIKTANKSYFK